MVPCRANCKRAGFSLNPFLVIADVGTVTAPIYAGHDAGITAHVWVDETRPRNQGASLTAWELGPYGMPHTVIADNLGAHLVKNPEAKSLARIS